MSKLKLSNWRGWKKNRQDIILIYLEEEDAETQFSFSLPAHCISKLLLAEFKFACNRSGE